MSDPTSPPVENPTGSEPAGAGEAPLEKCVIVRYGRMAQTGLFRHNLETAPAPGCMLVVRSERGVELGKVLTGLGDSSCPSYPRCINHDRLEDYLRANGPDYPFTRDGRVMRLATPQDLNEQQHLDRSGDEHATYCDQHIRQLGLDMKIVCVEHLLGGERIIFYFIASQRVDFRDLVKRLASQYHTRIEMRQVGARDEARLVAEAGGVIGVTLSTWLLGGHDFDTVGRTLDFALELREGSIEGLAPRIDDDGPLRV